MGNFWEKCRAQIKPFIGFIFGAMFNPLFEWFVGEAVGGIMGEVIKLWIQNNSLFIILAFGCVGLLIAYFTELGRLKKENNQLKKDQECKHINELKMNIMRCLRTLQEIRRIVSYQALENEEEVKDGGESWFGELPEYKEEVITDIQQLGREIIKSISHDEPLPCGINRHELIRACSAVRHGNFENLENWQILDSAVVALSSRKSQIANHQEKRNHNAK